MQECRAYRPNPSPPAKQLAAPVPNGTPPHSTPRVDVASADAALGRS